VRNGSAMKVSDVGQPDEEQGLLHKDSHSPSHSKAAARGPTIMGIPTVLFAGLCYCAASGSMVILNKHALNPKSFGFTAPNALLCFQCALAATLVKLCELAGLVKLQPLKRDLVSIWFPVNLIFVGMIGSSFYALQHVGVAMVTVWKNVSNFVTAVCDVTIYKKSYSTQVGECLLELPVLSACSNPQMPVAAVWDVTKLYARTFVVGV
jgi:GDP-mannose transporter